MPVLCALLPFIFSAGPVFAQPRASTSEPVLHVSARGGQVHGTVRDQIGRAVRDANVVAMGTTLAAAKSDSAGRFVLQLPVGDYILRATREGYVSTYREAVRIHTSALIERNITLTRLGVGTAQPAVLVAGVGARAQPPEATAAQPEPAQPDNHAHNEAAWRLRHLRRSVLRDGSASAVAEREDRDRLRSRTSVLDWAIDGSARAASAFFLGTDFNGQVYFVTTSSLDGSRGWLPSNWPRGIASASVGAPVGDHGDWLVRGAITAGDLSSWVFLGEYEGRNDQTHAIRAGVSFSAQGYAAHRTAPLSLPPTGARNVGGIYGFDRWRVTPRLMLDYGIRIDRYDYVPSRLLSPRLGTSFEVLPRTNVIAIASQRMIAPGIDEFLPPPSSGLWLPPERTFSAVVPGAPLTAERVRHLEVGVEHNFGSGTRTRTIALRHIHQRTVDQVATLFGLDAASGVGHYYVVNPGSVEINGWSVRADARINKNIVASLDYSLLDAEWFAYREPRLVRPLMPSIVRPDRERLHDVTASIDATIPETSTRVAAIYRVNSAFSSRNRLIETPVAGGRFDLEVHQGLPYQPVRGGRLELLFAVRSLFCADREPGSFYDELLTVAPPMRVMTGVQVKF